MRYFETTTLYFAIGHFTRDINACIMLHVRLFSDVFFLCTVLLVLIALLSFVSLKPTEWNTRLWISHKGHSQNLTHSATTVINSTMVKKVIIYLCDTWRIWYAQIYPWGKRRDTHTPTYIYILALEMIPFPP